MAWRQQARATGISDTSKSGVVKTAGRGLGDAWSAQQALKVRYWLLVLLMIKTIPSSFLGVAS